MVWKNAILLWATSLLPEFMTALLTFCLLLWWRWDGESSCAGGDAVLMYRALAVIRQAMALCLAGDRA